MKFLKAKKGDAEAARKRLAEEGTLDPSYSVEHAGEHVYFPLKQGAEVGAASVVEMEGKRTKARPRSLKEALVGVLSPEELEVLQSSYNVVGDIAILEFEKRLQPKKGEIGEAMLRTFKSLKVVALKTEQVSGEYRIPGVEVIAGEHRTETIHREHGCTYKLDVAQAYFSPRLGRERMRVAEKIGDDERILVMFAGVGPYAILAAKKTKADVTAVELNPKAVEYMRWNVLRNKVNVNVIEGDARAVLPVLGKFDRIVMPLPKQADTFLDVTLPALRQGGTIHYYTFAHDPPEASERLVSAVSALGKKANVLEAVECGSYSPCMSRICVDFTLE